MVVKQVKQRTLHLYGFIISKIYFSEGWDAECVSDIDVVLVTGERY